MNGARSNRVRPHEIRVALSDAEVTVLRRLAARSGHRLASYLRQVALAGGEPAPRLPTGLAAALGRLAELRQDMPLLARLVAHRQTLAALAGLVAACAALDEARRLLLDLQTEGAAGDDRPSE